MTPLRPVMQPPTMPYSELAKNKNNVSPGCHTTIDQAGGLLKALAKQVTCKNTKHENSIPDN